jgi:DNA-binding CsgD family transcriptional regulator
MQRTTQIEDIIDRVYESVLDPAGWEAVLASCARRLGGESAILYLKPHLSRTAAFMVASGFDPNYRLSEYLSYYEARSPLIPFYKQTPVGEVRALGEYAFSAAYRETEFYQDWIRPQRIADFLGSHLVRTPELYAWFAVRRSDRRRTYSAAEIHAASCIAGHVARAIKLRFRIERERAPLDGLRRSLDAVGFGILIVSADGKVLMANRAADEVLRRADGVKAHFGKLICRRSRETAALHHAIRVDARTALVSRPFGMHVSRGEGQRPYGVHVFPVTSPTTWGSFAPTAAAAALFVIDPDVPIENVEGLSEAYALTAAERRVLREVVRCRGLVDAARRLGIGLSTARTHLQRIFSKTNTSSQAELIRLAMTASLAPILTGPAGSVR